MPGVTGTLGKANSHFGSTQMGWGQHHHIEAAIDWCSSILLALHVYTIYTTEISHFTIQKDRSQYVFWGKNRKSLMMIRVKVNSKLELVEDREGKSALYGVICCCDDRLLSRAVICGHTV